MQLSSSPRFTGTCYYQFNRRDQRFDITGAVSQMRYQVSPDLTAVTEFENPSSGIAKMQISELPKRNENRASRLDTDLTRQAEAWMESVLREKGIERVDEKALPRKINWLF